MGVYLRRVGNVSASASFRIGNLSARESHEVTVTSSTEIPARVMFSSGIAFAAGDKLGIFHSTGNMTDVEIEPIWA